MTMSSLEINPGNRGNVRNRWLQQDSLDTAVKRMENDICSAPTDLNLRWGLFQALCLLGQWQRALKQLQVCVRLDTTLASTAHVMRDLIRSEMLRAAVFSGKKQPGYMVATPPPWMMCLLDALQTSDIGNADVTRESALSAAPIVAGECNLGQFNWIAESDSRLGPVCEMVVAGMYRWCPFNELTSLNIAPPHKLLDLIWIPAEAVLRDGSNLKVYLPVRYPGSEHGDDAVRLAGETHWREEGTTGVFGHGQKTWITDVGDVALLDLRIVTFTQST